MVNVKVILFCAVIFAPIINVYASNEDNIELLEQVNEAENTLRNEDKELENKISQLEKRISKFSFDIAETQTLKNDIEEKYKEILKKEATFSSVQKDISKNSLSIAEIKTNATSLRADQIRIEGSIDSSQKIITWVTLIVTVVVVLIGAFFSKSFIELYSNYRVVCARYPEVKPPEQNAET